MTNCLYNLEVEDPYHNVLRELGFEMETIQGEESDAGLGNGGLGRLAACFMDSLACLDMPAYGYGLRYQYGMFRQTIEDGYQKENPDYWLTHGTPFPQVERLDITFPVRFYGHTVAHPVEGTNKSRWGWEGGSTVQAVAYDCLCPGHHTNHVVPIRLWAARPSTEFDLSVHNSGNFLRSVAEKADSENITFVLYPNDSTEEGRLLRLKQEYFFVSASLQDILRRAERIECPFSKLGEKYAVQLNDTHPALGVPELMRLLLDVHGFEWEEAWEVVGSVFSYTNHTVLPEALEKWPLSILVHLLPRHTEIILEINRRFLAVVEAKWPGDIERLQRMSLVQEGSQKMVRMANLAIVASHKVNGVAALHSQIIKDTIFKDFYELWPTKFINVTNGVTPRRWISQCNRPLGEWITETLQSMKVIKEEHEWLQDMSLLKNLLKLESDADTLDAVLDIKRQGKERLCDYIEEHCGVTVSPDMLISTQVKRIHEYKRQLLCLLGLVHQYMALKEMSPEERKEKAVPRCHLFAGKAAPGYARAKVIIKMMNCIADVLNNDPETSDYLKLVFVPNYCVSNAEIIFPGTDVSEQISTAGHEASGTGNMKASMNGAIIIGTLDGANVEIREEIGEENMVIFGAEKHEVLAVRDTYNNGSSTQLSESFAAVLDAVDGGMFGHADLFAKITGELRSGRDFYLLAHDFDGYIQAWEEMFNRFDDQDAWARSMLHSIARMGKFNSDRSIQDYARDVWGIKPQGHEVKARKAALRSAKPVSLFGQ
ncbi:glycogen/starch/alpha-glucan phosphorylase [Kipferlia bialata]|uniref:Alpha-1,4 glucan phosphorylase n=1 Tax=Kipferlia bialata TaxID=797122 RepID=A0A9K3CVI3_9EUKA|nr:glycogen/starch/alpha-glucan phosphorylase [Kipferlia bialata]|eukprot:g4703.t1